jgi:hypothetical protein
MPVIGLSCFSVIASRPLPAALLGPRADVIRAIQYSSLAGDPEKFLSLVGEHAYFIASPDLLQLGRIHLSTWERLRSHLQSVGSPVLSEVERMLGGGLLKWEAAIENLVVNQGLDDVLDKYFKASAYTASHFVGLTDSTPTPAAGDTMAAHAGWTEVTAYTEGTRQSLVLGAVSGQSVDNSASKAVFSINATVTVGGAFGSGKIEKHILGLFWLWNDGSQDRSGIQLVRFRVQRLGVQVFPALP